jgi:hypothetical protein
MAGPAMAHGILLDAQERKNPSGQAPRFVAIAKGRQHGSQVRDSASIDDASKNFEVGTS